VWKEGASADTSQLYMPAASNSSFVSTTCVALLSVFCGTTVIHYSISWSSPCPLPIPLRPEPDSHERGFAEGRRTPLCALKATIIHVKACMYAL